MWPTVATKWGDVSFFWNERKIFLIRLDPSTFVFTRLVARLHSSTFVYLRLHLSSD